MLLPCPYCGSDVIQGTDECESCGQTLTDTHLPIPATSVERALLADRVKLFQGRAPSPFLPRCLSARSCGSWSITASAA